MNLSKRTSFVRIVLVSLFLVVSGCSTNSVQPFITQEAFLVKCPEVLPSNYTQDGKGWLLMAKEWSSEYHKCATRHNGTVDAIEEFNKK